MIKGAKNTEKKGKGIRYSEGKLPFKLLPWDAMVELVKVYLHGCGKYAPRNWEQGLGFDNTFDSLQRHAIAWYLGEDHDPDSGLWHMSQVAWNALALLAFQLRGRTDLDDRPKFSLKRVKKYKKKMKKQAKKKAKKGAQRGKTRA